MTSNKVSVVTDSIACIPSDLIEQYSIGIIPLNFYANGRVIKDGIDVTPSEAYQLFLKDPETFRTSSASPGDCIATFRTAAQMGNDVLAILLSAKLSAHYETGVNASLQVKSEIPGVAFKVMDSQTAAAAEGLITLAAAREAQRGKDLAEVTAMAERVRHKVALIAYMDTVRYIYRSGRIPKIAAMAGSMLKIRPVFTITGGVPHFVGAVRNKSVGIERLIEVMHDKINGHPAHVAVMHVYAEGDAIRLKERVAREFNCVELWQTEFSPLMGYACGTGTIGLAFYPDD